MNVKKDVHEYDKFFENYHFRIIKKLQIYAGIWPYESLFNKIFSQLLLHGSLIGGAAPAILGLKKSCVIEFQLDLCAECVVTISYALTILAKHWVTFLSEKEFKNIYERLAENWLQIVDNEEQAILEQYAGLGRIKAIVYLTFMIMAGFCFCQVPIVPFVLDYIKPLNESRPKIPPLRGEYVFDPIKHFSKVYMFYILTTVINVITMTSIDGTYTVIVHQIIGILMIVKHRIHLATLNVDSLKDVSFNIITKAIRLHKEALEFIDMIQTSYKLLFFIEIGNTIIFISLCVTVVLGVNTPLLFIRIVMVLCGSILHFWYISWPGQNIIDYSMDLFVATYTNEWYNISEKSKTLLKIMMLRTMKPCTFSAGGLYIMNLENFGSIIKTALSYVTVMTSYR